MVSQTTIHQADELLNDLLNFDLNNCEAPESQKINFILMQNFATFMYVLQSLNTNNFQNMPKLNHRNILARFGQFAGHIGKQKPTEAANKTETIKTENS